MPLWLSRSFRVLVFGAVFTALFSCSNEEVNPPAELVDFEPSVKLKRLWKTSVGAGDDDLKLSLSPVMSGQQIFTLSVDGLLSALEIDTGKLLWERDLDELVSGGLGLDALSLYYTTFQGQIVSIDRESGNPRWRRTLVSEAISAPASNGSTVVVQTIDGRLAAFDASEGNQRWRYDGPGSILSLRGTPTPLLTAESVITSFSNGEMLSFDLRNGSVNWKTTVGVPQGRTELERLVDPDGRPALFNERVYAVAYQGDMVALDVRSGREIWSKPVSSFNGLSVNEKHVYATLADGTVLAVNKTNSNDVWRNEKLKYRRLTTPYVFGSYVALTDYEGYLHLLSSTNGEFVARVRPDSDGIMGDMLVLDDRLYVYTRSGDVLAYQLTH